MKRELLMATCALALATGCRDKATEVSSTQTTGATEARQVTPMAPNPDTTEPAAGGIAPKLTEGDRTFVTKAAQGGMLEVVLGQQVASKAASPAIKSFADHMVRDHGKANEELKQLASTKGVALPTQLDDDHQKLVDKLAKLNGSKLDEAYAKDMVDDHEEDVKQFRDAAKDLTDPDLRAWAARTLPTLEMHLAMAKDAKNTAKKR